MALASCGGLRCAELEAVKDTDFIQDNEGVWVSDTHAKRRGEEKKNHFLVPFDRDLSQCCFASRVVS